MNLVLVGLPVYLTVVLSGRKAAVKICPTSYIGIVAYASKLQAGADAACIGFLIFTFLIHLFNICVTIKTIALKHSTKW